MVPVLAVYAGYSLQRDYVPAGSRLRPYVRDALDEIQYAAGSVHTTWGARRAADGQPTPFIVPYVEIGNEDFFDRSSSYDSRFAQFYDAIKVAYPTIKLIATTDVFSRKSDVVDEHYYMTPAWFSEHANQYDAYSRSGPKIFVGEYAAQTANIGQGEATLGGALGKAAWMTGLERNADVVIMASYAPLFQNVNQFEWSPDLISYDNLVSYGSPSYYVQELFGVYHGDTVLPSTLSGSATLFDVASKVSRDGTIYLTVVNTGPSTQATHVAFKGITTVAKTGTVTVLKADGADAENSLISPTAVVPRTHLVSTLGASFTHSFPANSVTVFRLNAK